jgi:hypothetical protein
MNEDVRIPSPSPEGDDPTVAERKRLLPIVNRPAQDAMMAAGAQIREAVEATGKIEFTDEEVAELRRQRDDEATRQLRAQLAATHGEDNVFDISQLSQQFDVIGFAAPIVVVTRLADGQKGSLYFTHHPRLYYGFEPHQP